jgi:hypothetical protein
MDDKMLRSEKETRGAWIIHHGRKISLDVSAPAEFPALDESAKGADLLTRLAQSDEAELTKAEVDAVAKAAGLNPRSELPHYLNLLSGRRLIDMATTGDIRVLGLSPRAVLTHASDMLNDANPTTREEAAIELSEVSSQSPQSLKEGIELISDTHSMALSEATDFVRRSIDVGFVDFEGDHSDGLLFNGNLFKRDSVLKSQKVLASLSSAEQTKMTEFNGRLTRSGCVLASQADVILGSTLFEKLKAAGIYEINTVSNEIGTHAFVTSPGAFHKYVNPLVDDSFDMAKALVSALTYGMQLRPASQGRIVNFDWILNALIQGRTIGPATAIGADYRVLEESRVIQLFPASGGMFRMKLLKREIGELARVVLQRGDANAETVRAPIASPMTSYVGPEPSRIAVRRLQRKPSKQATRDILSALRGGRV